MNEHESHYLSKWRRAADDLGIEVVGPVDVRLPSGVRVHAPVLVRFFGGPEGMLILPAFDPVRHLTDEIVQAGYGYSVMSEPRAEERYLRSGFIDVLADWGWHGPESETPAWLRDVSPDAE